MPEKSYQFKQKRLTDRNYKNDDTEMEGATLCVDYKGRIRWFSSSNEPGKRLCAYNREDGLHSISKTIMLMDRHQIHQVTF